MVKLILQSIRKRKKKLILIVVQFIIGFCSLLFSLCTIGNLLQYKKNIKQLAPLNSYHLCINNNGTEPLSSESAVQYKKMCESLKGNALVDKMGVFERIYLSTNEKEANEVSSIVIMSNLDLLSMADFKLSSGSMEEVMNYEISDGPIPIVISGFLKEKYYLGGEYSFLRNLSNGSNKEVTFKVVGILEDSICFWKGGSSSITENVFRNKDFIICPLFSEFDLASPYLTNTLLSLNQTESKVDDISQIEKIYNKYGLSPEFNTLESEIRDYYSRQKFIVMGTMIFAIIILLLSVLGCIGTILSSIISRKKEFGIYFSLGLTKKNLVCLVCGEIIVLFLFSFLVASVTSTVVINGILASEGFVVNIRILACAFLIMFICALLCIITPLKKVTALNPIDLVNGRDN